MPLFQTEVLAGPKKCIKQVIIARVLPLPRCTSSFTDNSQQLSCCSVPPRPRKRRQMSLNTLHYSSVFQVGLGIPVVVLSFAVPIVAWRVRRARKQRAISSGAHHRAEDGKPEIAADLVEIPAELDTDPPWLPAQILEAELSEEGIMAGASGRVCFPTGRRRTQKSPRALL